MLLNKETFSLPIPFQTQIDFAHNCLHVLVNFVSAFVKWQVIGINIINIILLLSLLLTLLTATANEHTNISFF